VLFIIFATLFPLALILIGTALIGFGWSEGRIGSISFGSATFIFGLILYSKVGEAIGEAVEKKILETLL
jgi:hypothetical protein